MWLLRLLKKRFTIQSVPGERWFSRDTLNMQGFFHSETGKKWLEGIRYSLYQEVMEPKQKTEWEDGRRAGMAHIINSIEDILAVDAGALIEMVELEQQEIEEEVFN